MERPALRALAERMRIQPSYVDQTGKALRHTSDATRLRLLAAMGIDASTEERAQHALEKLRRAERRQWIDPVRVVRQNSRRISRIANKNHTRSMINNTLRTVIVDMLIVSVSFIR